MIPRVTSGPNGLSGDEALRLAAERAASTGTRNLPEFTDLPIPGDTANLREGPDLNDECLGLLPLIGVWRGALTAVSGVHHGIPKTQKPAAK